MLTEEQKDNILMEAEEHINKDKRDFVLFVFAELFIEFILIMLWLNKENMLIGFILANIIMLIYLISIITEYRANPYGKVAEALSADNYILDAAYLTAIREETRMTRHRNVIHTGKFTGTVYKVSGRMDLVFDFVLDYVEAPTMKDRVVTVVKFPEVKDNRKGYNEEFTILYMTEE